MHAVSVCMHAIKSACMQAWFRRDNWILISRDPTHGCNIMRASARGVS